MNLTRFNILFGLLLLVMSAFAVFIDVDHTQLNYEFLPEMKRSPASSAFAANQNFSNGRTLQKPVLGTIARGDLPLYYELTKEDALRAGEELLNPFAFTKADELAAQKAASEQPAISKENATPTKDKTKAAQPTPKQAKPDPRAKLNASISRGAKIYGVYCVSCHGPKGAGDGMVAKRGFPPPPPLTTGKSVKMKDGQLFHILSYGQGSMTSMAVQLTRARRWDAINYVRSMQQGAMQSQQQSAEATPNSQPATPKTSSKPSKPEEKKP